MKDPVHAFTDLTLLPSLQTSLTEQGLVTPTQIQQRALPALLAGRSVVGVAETGSGKTLAYALPILHTLKSLEMNGSSVDKNAHPRAVVVVPTRELGEQVAKVFKPFTHTTRLRVRTVLGGTDIDIAKKNIAGPFEVLVATPGRLIKLLDRKLLHFDDVRMLVFDEADQMLDQGFMPDATQIVKACPPRRQLAMFSATVSPVVEKLIGSLFGGAEVIRTDGSHQLPATLTTVNREVVNGERLPLLKALLGERVVGGTMLFVNTREQCDAVASAIASLGWTCTIYRGEMDKVERRNNLQSFRDGEVDLLVSTDLASRGLDVEHVGRVINVHLPKELDNYMHRVGRTARAGRAGVVVNLVTERDAPLMQQVDKLAAAPRGPTRNKPRTSTPKPKPAARAGAKPAGTAPRPSTPVRSTSAHAAATRAKPAPTSTKPEPKRAPRPKPETAPSSKPSSKPASTRPASWPAPAPVKPRKR